MAASPLAWKAQFRLGHRHRRLAAAGKRKAREMVGFIWAIARMVQPRPAIGDLTAKEVTQHCPPGA